MKNVKTNGLFLVAFAVLVLAALGGIWWGVASIFVSLTGDELRGDSNATLFVIAVLFFIIALLHADDKRTALLAQVLCGVFVVLGAVLFVANATFESVGSDLSKTPEALAWAIPMTWTLPVVIGLIGFVLMSLDKYFGTDKQPILGASNSGVINMLYHGLYNVLIVSALVSSAFGTYEVMYGITQSFWHAMIYVGTVELAIYVFASFTHRTKDQEVFWYTFGLTIFAFAVANIFQIVSAVDKLSGGIETQDTAAAFARSFVLLPPILMGAIAGGLYLYNQRKPFVPFKEGTKESKGGYVPNRSQSPERGEGRPMRQERDFRNNESRREESGGDAPLRMPQGRQFGGRGEREQDEGQERGNQNVRSSQQGGGKKHQQHERKPDGYMPTEVSEGMKRGMRERGYSESQISGLSPDEVLHILSTVKKTYKEVDGVLKPLGETQGQGKNVNGNGQNFR